MVATCLAIALLATANCILRERTCPGPGVLRELLEDALTAALGFAGGRLSANGK